VGLGMLVNFRPAHAIHMTTTDRATSPRFISAKASLICSSG
jgi:hypothetical protein